jgi:hypothetical protein
MSEPTVSSILENCGRLDCLPLFEENEINIDQLPELSMEDLKEIGIEKLGHRRSILAAIKLAFAAPLQTGLKAAKPKRIFFSYGHDANRELIDRFKADRGVFVFANRWFLLYEYFFSIASLKPRAVP